MAWQDDPVVKSPDAQGSPAAWQADQVVPTTSPDQFATPPSSVLQRLRQGVAAVTQYPAQEAPGEPETDQGATVKAIRQGWAAGLDPTGFAKTWAAINNGTSAMSNLNPLKGIAETASAIVKPIDAGTHLLSGVMGAAGYGIGDLIGQAAGAQPGEREGFKQETTEALGWATALIGAKPGPMVPMENGSLARLTRDATTGKMEAQPVGPMPTPQMVADTAAAIKGIVAYHGSPHDFDVFSLDKIGTGEGAQNYGQGLYFAEHPDVAEQYRDAARLNTPEWDALTYAEHQIALKLGKFDTGVAAAEWLEQNSTPVQRQHIFDAMERPAHLYQIRIYANKDDFLDLDKPLSEQSQSVKDAIAALEPGYRSMLNDPEATGEKLVREMGDNIGKAEASKALYDAGIPGSKYLDQGSRSAEVPASQQHLYKPWGGDLDVPEPTHNFVLFNDKIAEITHKNGVPVGQPIEQKVADYWKQGVHPAEVLEAAKESPVMARDLSSARTPPMPIPTRPPKDWLNELDSRFFQLDAEQDLTKLQFQKFVEKEFPNGISPETDEAWFRTGEGDPQARPLTPAEAEGYNKYVLPLKQRSQNAFEELRSLRAPAEVMDELDPDYMHRMVVGKTPQIDQFTGGEEPTPYYGPGIFNTNPSGAKPRKYFVLEGEQGQRQLVRIGDGGKVFAIQKGEKATPVKYEEHNLEEPKENRTVTKGDILTVNGSYWNVKTAYTREIEDVASLRYHKTAIGSLINNIVHLESAVRGFYELQRTRSSPEWDAATSGENATATPKMPMFQNDKMDPKLANVIDNHWNTVNAETLPRVLYNVNRFAIGSMFWNPLVHDLNMTSDWFTSRGWDNLNPLAIGRGFKTTAQATKSVVTQDATFERLVHNGLALQTPGILTRNFFEKILGDLGTDVTQNHTAWQKLFIDNKLSPVNWGKQWMTHAANSMWAYGDVLKVQHVMELTAKGLSEERAIEETNRFMSTYRTKPEIFGSKLARDVVYSPLLTVFTRYGTGIYDHFANMASDLAKGTGQGRMNAVGKVMSLTAMSMIVGPALSAIYDKLTGSEAKFGPYGAARVANIGFSELVDATKSFWPQAVQDYYGSSHSTFLGYLMAHLSPVTQLALGLGSNLDYAGRRIRQPGDTAIHQAGQAAEYGAQQLFSPYNSLVQTANSGLTSTDAIAKILFGARVPSENANPAKQEERQENAIRSREKHPRGPIEELAE